MWLQHVGRFGLATLLCVLGCSAALSSAPAHAEAAPFRLRVFTFVDHSRTIRLPDGRRVPRSLETAVRVPSASAPHPLIVFAHGFTLSPWTYSALLDAWAKAGYVVAAPAFPLEKAGAPGGPDESDLANEPADISLVISRLLAMNARASSVLFGTLDPSEVGVAGHSDGAVAALAVAYDRRFRDPRISAAVVLSGAALSGMGAFPRRGPPLLAVQGTADPINVPASTSAYYRLARRPKFLLWLTGASHLPPYTDEQPQLGIVERATAAFFAHYLEGRPLAVFERAARRRGLTQLTAHP